MPIWFPYRSVIFTYPERLWMPCSSHLKCKAFKIKSSLFYLHTGQTVRLIGEDSINRHRPFWRSDWRFIFSVFHKRFNRYASDGISNGFTCCRILNLHGKSRIDYADCWCVCSCLIAGLFCYFAFRRNRKINCYNFMLFLTGRYGILWDFASHVSKSPDMIIKTAALNVIPLTPGLISKTTCAAFLNQFHPFLVRTFGMSLNHSCPTPLLCTMSILDKQHFTLNQTCPMS